MPVPVEGSDPTIAKDNRNTNTPTPGQQKQQRNQKPQGTLTSDLLGPLPGPSSRPASPATRGNSTGKKIHLSATNSHFRVPNTGLSDLESALRTLELTAAPNSDKKRSTCNCMATIHDLLLVAPNCLSCGKIICIKEGLGPCTFCGTPLLNSSETEDMISFLKAERGREKMQAENSANRRAQVTREKPKLYSQGQAHPGAGYGAPAASGSADGNDNNGDDDAAALQRAREHRDKLLSFQAANAQRTKIIDEAADFDTSAVSSAGFAGLNMWATPEERALQLKKQQKQIGRAHV